MKINQFINSHKIISFLIIILTTIILTRLITPIHDPNIIIKGFELHHFYYGITLLIISNILMLYKRSNFQTNILLSGISIGLIIDELIFIGKNIPNNQYPSTWPSAIIAIIIVLLITEFIFYKMKKQSK